MFQNTPVCDMAYKYNQAVALFSFQPYYRQVEDSLF